MIESLVTSWTDLTNLHINMSQHFEIANAVTESPSPKQRFDEVVNKITNLGHKCFYDPKTGKNIILDVTKEGDILIKYPQRQDLDGHLTAILKIRIDECGKKFICSEQNGKDNKYTIEFDRAGKLQLMIDDYLNLCKEYRKNNLFTKFHEIRSSRKFDTKNESGIKSIILTNDGVELRHHRCNRGKFSLNEFTLKEKETEEVLALLEIKIKEINEIEEKKDLGTNGEKRDLGTNGEKKDLGTNGEKKDLSTNGEKKDINKILYKDLPERYRKYKERRQ